MASYSVVEAKNNLSSLIDKALNGESITITRHGTPVIELRPTVRRAKRMTAADLQWLQNERVVPAIVQATDAGRFVSHMRDEWDERLVGLQPPHHRK
jgi:prevent-host-death family protein